jgi:NAD(P)H-dependent FMN reductase
MHITVLNGTGRVGNQSQHVAVAIAEALKQHADSVTLTDVATHLRQPVTVPPWGEGGADSVPTEWQTLVQTTNAFVFVLPEYNHSYPGEWKLLMDSLYKEYIGKRAYVVAVSSGQLAGARVMEHVMPVLVNFQFRIGAARLHIANVNTAFSPEGILTDDATRERLDTFVAAIIKPNA